MTRLKTLRCNLLPWWIPPILATVSSEQLEHVLIGNDLTTFMPWISDYFLPWIAQWKETDEIVARILESVRRSGRTPPFVLFSVPVDATFTPLACSRAECQCVFDIFEKMRSGGFCFGLRAYYGVNIPAEDLWWNKTAPDFSFPTMGMIYRAGVW